jgi:purine-cytosine permease-like protein
MSNKVIESQGVHTIPEHQRTAKPGSIIPIFLGSNMALSVMVFGWLAVLYGLSWWQSVSAILVGTVAAALFVNLSRAGISEAFGFLVICMSCVLLLLSGPLTI